MPNALRDVYLKHYASQKIVKKMPSYANKLYVIVVVFIKIVL
jgi:hypothetical protein